MSVDHEMIAHDDRSSMGPHSKTVLAFLEALTNRDYGTAGELMTEDMVFEDRPANLHRGRDAILQRLGVILSIPERITWPVDRFIEEGDLVVTERKDEFSFREGLFPGGTVLSCPILAVWEMRGGKIALWRDYYDPNTIPEQLGVDGDMFRTIVVREYERITS